MTFDAPCRIANPRATSPPSAYTSEELDATLQAYMDDLDLMLACMEGSGGGTLPHNSTEYQPDGCPLTTVAAGNTSTNSAWLGQGTVATASESTFTHTPPHFTDYSAYTNEFDFLSSDIDLSALHMPPLNDGSSIPPLPGDGVGDQIISSHACETSASNVVSSSAFRSNILGNPQVSCAQPWDGISFASETQWNDTGSFIQVGPCETMPQLSWWDTIDTNSIGAAPINTLTETTTAWGAGSAGTVLGKRARNSGPSTSWALDEAEGSRKRVHPSPDTGAQHTDKRYIYEVVVQSREACPTTTQGLYPHPMPGPSALQEVAESQDEPHAGGSTEGREDLYEIPGKLTKRQRLLLRTTEDDLRRLAVPTIKCRLCPDAKWTSWQCFQRHCNTSEDHPVQITFCQRCGDYFGRRDSLKRHQNKRNQDGCRMTSRREAERKITETQQIFDDFNLRMEKCLRTGEELGTLFAELARENIRSESTSKKTSKSKGTQSESNS